MLGPENCIDISPAPEANASTILIGVDDLTYCTSVKPSAFKKSSATNSGATQTETAPDRGIRIVVVSSLSATAVGEAGMAPQASSSAIPAADRPKSAAVFKSWRRLKRLAFTRTAVIPSTCPLLTHHLGRKMALLSTSC